MIKEMLEKMKLTEEDMEPNRETVKDMDRAIKIKKMDTYLHDLRTLSIWGSDIAGRLEDALPKLKELMDYYGTEEWLDDMEDYQNGKLLLESKSYILQENSVYDLCVLKRETAIRMLEMATKIIKDCKL